MEKRTLFAVIIAVVVVVAAVSLYIVFQVTSPGQEATHTYVVQGDSDWFDLPGGTSTDVSAMVTDNGAPRYGIPVDVTAVPDSEGTLTPANATTDTYGNAHFTYTAFNRTDNQTITFTFKAVIDGQERAGSTEIRQLGMGMQPTLAGVKGLVLRNPDRLPILNATIQVNLRDMTGLAVNTPSFYSNNSNAQGWYVMKGIPPRASFIQIYKSGFKSQHDYLNFTAGRYTRIDFVMDPLTGKVLTIWHTYSGKEQDEFNKLVDRYRALHPELNIQVEFQPYAGAPEKFIVAATAGNAPDIMRFQNDRLGEVASLGYLEPLDSRLDPATIQRFTPATLATMTIQGHVYALPATQDLLAIVYNKAIFTSANEKFPDNNWTTDDMIRIATNLTTTTRYGFVTPQTIGFYWFPWLTGYGGQIFTVPDTTPITQDSDLGLNTVAAAKSVLFMQSLDKVRHLMFSNPGEDPMLTEFLQGNAAMITTGPWNIPAVERAEINYGIVPYPIVSDTGLRARPTLGVKGFGIWKLSSVKDDAFDFLKFMTDPAQQKIFSLGSDGVPGTNDIPTDQEAFSDPAFLSNPVIAAYLLQAGYSSEFPSRPEMSNVWGPVADGLTFIYNDKVNPADPSNSASIAAAQAQLTIVEQQIYG